jgi:hypothetical protein
MMFCTVMAARLWSLSNSMMRWQIFGKVKVADEPALVKQYQWVNDLGKRIAHEKALPSWLRS